MPELEQSTAAAPATQVNLQVKKLQDVKAARDALQQVASAEISGSSEKLTPTSENAKALNDYVRAVSDMVQEVKGQYGRNTNRQAYEIAAREFNGIESKVQAMTKAVGESIRSGKTFMEAYDTVQTLAQTLKGIEGPGSIGTLSGLSSALRPHTAEAVQSPLDKNAGKISSYVAESKELLTLSNSSQIKKRVESEESTLAPTTSSNGTTTAGGYTAEQVRSFYQNAGSDSNPKNGFYALEKAMSAEIDFHTKHRAMVLRDLRSRYPEAGASDFIKEYDAFNQALKAAYEHSPKPGPNATDQWYANAKKSLADDYAQVASPAIKQALVKSLELSGGADTKEVREVLLRDLRALNMPQRPVLGPDNGAEQSRAPIGGGNGRSGDDRRVSPEEQERRAREANMVTIGEFKITKQEFEDRQVAARKAAVAWLASTKNGFVEAPSNESMYKHVGGANNVNLKDLNKSFEAQVRNRVDALDRNLKGRPWWDSERTNTLNHYKELAAGVPDQQGPQKIAAMVSALADLELRAGFFVTQRRGSNADINTDIAASQGFNGRTPQQFRGNYFGFGGGYGGGAFASVPQSWWRPSFAVYGRF